MNGRRTFCVSHQSVSGFPEQGADLWGGPVTSLGRSGGVLGKFGKLLGNLWIALRIHSERSSGEVRGNSGIFEREFPEALEKSDSSQRLATNCLQTGVGGGDAGISDSLGTLFGCFFGCFQCRAFGTSVGGRRNCKACP